MADADRQYEAMRAATRSLDPATSDLPVSDEEFFRSFGGNVVAQSIPVLDLNGIVNFSSEAPNASNLQPSDVANTMYDPNIPTNVKRNVVSAAYATPEMRNELAQRLGSANQRAAEEKAQIAADSNMMASILQAAQPGIEQKAKNEAEIIKVKQQQQATLANEYSHYLSDKGINLSDVRGYVNTEAVNQLDRHKQMMALDAEIRADQSVSFLNNPLDWLFAQFDMGPKIDAHNAIASQYNKSEEYIKSSAQMASAVRDANAGKVAAMTQTEAELLAQNKLIDAQKDILKLQEEEYKVGVNARKESRAVDDKVTSQLSQAVTHQDAQEAKEKAFELHKLQVEDLMAGRKLRRDAEAEKLRAKRTAEEEQADRDKLVADALGRYNITTEKQFNKLPPKERERMGILLKSYDETKGYGIYGTTPVDVLTNTATIKTKSGELNEGQQVLLRAMNGFKEQTNTAGMNKDMALDAVNANIRKNVKVWMDNPTTKGPLGPEGEAIKLFNVPPLETIAQQPSLGGNKAALTVNDLVASLPKGTPITDQMLVNALASKVEKGNISDIAKDLSQFYKTGVAAVNRSVQPDRFALPPMSSFNVPLPTGYFGGKDKYDLASVKGATIALARTNMQASREPGQIMDMSQIIEGRK